MTNTSLAHKQKVLANRSIDLSHCLYPPIKVPSSKALAYLPAHALEIPTHIHSSIRTAIAVDAHLHYLITPTNISPKQQYSFAIDNALSRTRQNFLGRRSRDLEIFHAFDNRRYRRLSDVISCL